jgi:DNA-directed RNA polymerase specialized sigma24 family protein
MTSSASPAWEILAVAYLTGHGDLAPLYEAAQRPFKRMVGRLSPSLPPDLQEDAVQQVFVRLLENAPAYDPARCSVRTLFYGLLRNAVKQVRAMNIPPGRKTRIENEQESRVPPAEMIPRYAIVETENTLQEIDEIPTPRWTPENIQTLARSSELLTQLPAEVAAAAWLVHGLEHSIVEAAGLLKKSRFAVARCLRQARRAA